MRASLYCLFDHFYCAKGLPQNNLYKFLQVDVWHSRPRLWLFASVHSRGRLCHIFVKLFKLFCGSP